MRTIPLLNIAMILLIQSCTNANPDRSPGTIVDKSSFKKVGTLSLKDWRCTDNDKICIPSNWRFKTQSEAMFYAHPDTANKLSYFVILKYNEISTGVNSSIYLKGQYKALLKDTVERFLGYSLKKLYFADKQTFYGEYFTSIKNVHYLTFSTVMEIDHNLYDIGLKIKGADYKRYKEVYRNILFNFYHNGTATFSEDDKIKSFETIDLSKL